MSVHMIDALGPARPGPALDPDDVDAITALQVEYCASVDSGDFERFAGLFLDGTWLGIVGDEVHNWMRYNIFTYDGATHTRHQVHDIALAWGGSQDEVHGTCAILVTQRLPGEQVTTLVTHNTYSDCYHRVDGLWRFSSRAMTRRLPGDDSRHRRPAPSVSPERPRSAKASDRVNV